jgi:hypothetical protein
MITLSCVRCDKELESATENWPEEHEYNQPYDGTTFISHGQYGSTVWDPFDGSYIEINVCDDCLQQLAADKNVLVTHPKRNQPEQEICNSRHRIAYHPAKYWIGNPMRPSK